MKVLGINGSPRKNGNTSILLSTVLDEIAQTGIETEMIQLGGKAVRGCTACMQCREKQNGKCVISDDPINDIIEKMRNADGILIGSPVYFASPSTEIKALIDRAGFVSLGNGRILQRKVGAAVVAVRRAGATNTFDAINRFFFINGMIVPGATYWNLGIGQGEGEVRGDEEGMNNMKALGQNMAWLLQKLVD